MAAGEPGDPGWGDNDPAALALSLMATFGSWIRQARKNSDRLTSDVAERAGVHPSFLCDIEHDRRRPSLEVARRLARALKLDVAETVARAGLLTPRAEQLLRDDHRLVARLNRMAEGRAA